MKVQKIEHHSVNWYYTAEIDEDLLSEIYPDLSEEEIRLLELELSTGTKNIDDVLEDAWENSVDIEWEFDRDDVWTDRKGGYEVTYSIED